MSKTFEFQLLLRFNDQVSRGLKSAMQAAKNESKGLENSISGVAAATARIRTTPIERLTSALRTMRSAASSAHETLMKISQVGMAAAAGGYVLKRAAERPMAYDRRLALMANTAYSERDVAGRIVGKAELDKAIRNATKNGLGTPEQAAETLNTLVGSGAMGNGKAGLDSSMKLLPVLQKAATGTGASANDLAQIAIAAKQNMGLSDEQIPLAISKAIRAGQLGGFELDKMARWLPQQMAMAANNGMKGMSGFESLISANQAARMTAGTEDEAGNNLVNLLAKVTSNDTANDFKRQHIDLYGSLTASMANGKNSLESFVAIVQKLGSKDPKYLELKSKADAAKNEPEKQKLYEAMADVMMAKGIGNSVQDRQALTGLFGMMSPSGKYQEVLEGVRKEQGGEIATSFGTVNSTVDAKAERLGNVKAYAAIDALGAVEGPLGKMLTGVNEVADAHPKLAAAAYAAATALAGLSVASGAGKVFGFLKGKLPGGFANGAEAAESGLNASKVAAPSLLSRLALPLGEAGFAATAGGLLAAGAAGYGVGTLVYNNGFAGTEAGDKLGSMIAKLLAKLGNEEAGQALEINLHLDGEKIATVVNRQNVKQGNRQ